MWQAVLRLAPARAADRRPVCSLSLLQDSHTASGSVCYCLERLLFWSMRGDVGHEEQLERSLC